MRLAFVVRVAAIIAVPVLFVTDYGLDGWSSPVPGHVYLLLLLVALGIDARTLRELILAALSKPFNRRD